MNEFSFMQRQHAEPALAPAVTMQRCCACKATGKSCPRCAGKRHSHIAATRAQAKHGPLSQNNHKDNYKTAQVEFWTEVRASADPDVRAYFEDARFAFESGNAPLLKVKDPSKVGLEERRISLDHRIEKGEEGGWQHALDPSNLAFELQTPNSIREVTQARHPELRPDRSQ